MNKKFLFLFIVVFVFQIPVNAFVSEHFNDFYCDYLDKRNIKIENREILNLIQKITEDKIIDIEEFLNKSKTDDDKIYAISLIDEEYREFLENINFELNYIPNCPLKKRAARKFKKAHKKFMRQLKKCYLN